ncbi:LOW QUALITY PROTEIN: EF-hand domain-containing family member C2 [Phycodurus eques]|uniref:LOW QUALITY PROTEIN: EF-hand domain-containing family member C2 n=1 Tax=Phycodurus eques TaxID=693459 RepID=UPI002ACE2DDA|nr:LOW QUALITY PROTEIN: EF-hand domain-containing family member C2 [Phycodurus eques]
MALPFLPGNSPNTHVSTEKFHKSQHFDYSSGVPSEKPGIGGELLPGRRLKGKSSVYPKVATGGLPPWLAFDKQALRFEAYFQEAVPEAPDETDRIRTCQIYFYPEDDTIRVVEPEYKNSGLRQGTLIRRQRIPLPPPKHERFYDVFHFNLNRQMALFSRTFTVTDCDRFTRNFLTKCGVLLNEPVAVPQDPYRRLREKMEKSVSPLRPYERRDTLKQFLEHDGKVLRFLCLWDDERAAGGDPRELLLRYFVADDSVEIREGGRGAAAAAPFLRRGKLPKRPRKHSNLPGQLSDRAVLNALASGTRGDRFVPDGRKTGAIREEFYKDCDLTLGGELNVWGRKVVIADCDDFTKDFYRSKYGIEHFEPVRYKSPAAPEPPGPVPPYNGFGSEEDSPKPPQKDLLKFLQYDSASINVRVKVSILLCLALDCRIKPRTSQRTCEAVVVLGAVAVVKYQLELKENAAARKLVADSVADMAASHLPLEIFAMSMAQPGPLGLCLAFASAPVLREKCFCFAPRCGLESHVLKFYAKMVSSSQADSDREFIVSFYLSDDTIGVFERSQKNSGVFLSRRRVKKPGREWFKKEPCRYFGAPDLHVGATLGLNERRFRLLDADEYTLDYMERHAEQFPKANIGAILAKLRSIPEEKQREIRNFLTLSDPTDTGFVTFDSFRGLQTATECGLSEHELLVLGRSFAERRRPGADVGPTPAEARRVLERKNFERPPDVAGADRLERPAPPAMPDDIAKFDVKLRRDASGGKKINYSSLLREAFPAVSGAADPST